MLVANSNQEERFWLCVDVGKQYGLHMLRRTSCTQLQWCGPVSATSLMLENSLGLGMEIPSPCVDGCHSEKCDWKGLSSEAYRHRVSLGTGDGHGRQDLAPKEMLADLLTKHVDAAMMLNCVAGLGLRFQSGESKLTLKCSENVIKQSSG